MGGVASCMVALDFRRCYFDTRSEYMGSLSTIGSKCIQDSLTIFLPVFPGFT